MNAKIKQLTRAFPRRKIDAFLVTKDINITYLTGFPACESWLLAAPRCASYITDFRYVHEAREGLKGKGVRVKRYTDSIYATLAEAIAAARIKRIGIDTRHLSLAQYRMLERR
ncbi:MAG: aminopeptidase P family N-terminal domain-containing protein, partial [Candidatus Omnitrophica bacterium]|nr:aminopeptidase P family N-terminal domain-containing protein [Candidatus Omnitrophota bacterium]